MNFDDYISESFNLENAGRHLLDAAKHKSGTPEHNKHMALHHSQMYWHHTHAGESDVAKHHFTQMKKHDA